MNEWTVYDGTNPPTDTSKPIQMSWHVVGVRTYEAGKWKQSWDMDGNEIRGKLNAYRYLDTKPYPPEPELVPCRCGGEAKERMCGSYTRITCQICFCNVEAPTKPEAIRMWNAAMAKTKRPKHKLILPDDIPKPEPDMPETAWLNDRGEYNDMEVEGQYSYPYIQKSKTEDLLDRLAKAEEQNERQSKALELIAESYRNIEQALMPLFDEIKERNE
jgi:hypothetical protein